MNTNQKEQHRADVLVHDHTSQGNLGSRNIIFPVRSLSSSSQSCSTSLLDPSTSLCSSSILLQIVLLPTVISRKCRSLSPSNVLTCSVPRASASPHECAKRPEPLLSDYSISSYTCINNPPLPKRHISALYNVTVLSTQLQHCIHLLQTVSHVSFSEHHSSDIFFFFFQKTFLNTALPSRYDLFLLNLDIILVPIT